MQKEFLKSYTSEILDQDTSRLLALVKANVNNLDAKVGWRWVPWKFRLSQKACDDKDSIALASRPRKIAKLDLSDLLLDDIPLREIPPSGQLGNYVPAFADSFASQCCCGRLWSSIGSSIGTSTSAWGRSKDTHTHTQTFRGTSQRRRWGNV